MATKTENWKGWGRVSVSRDARGRFVHWELIKNLGGFGGRAVSVYGRCKTSKGDYSGRYDFEFGTHRTGTVRELRDAIVLSLHQPPRRRHITVPAREFLHNPYAYGSRGHWVGRPDIDS
jgi:hypothetical protein